MKVQRWLALWLVTLGFFFAGYASLLAQGMNEVLEQHDPTTNLSMSVASTTPATSGGSSTSVDQAWQKIFQRLTSLLERLTKVIAKLTKATPEKPTKVSTPPKPEAPKPAKPDTSVGTVAQKVASVAKSFVSRYNGYKKFPYAAGTEGGNLGCANVVSKALKEAGVNVWSLNCDGVKNALLGLKAPKNWKKAKAPPYQPGDVVIWKAPSGGRHKHIGIVVKNGNSMSAMNNSSGKRKPILSTPVNYRAVECVIRKA